MNALLPNRVAIVYGGGGAIGGAVARAFEREGATLLLPGREVDALDENAVEAFSRSPVLPLRASRSGRASRCVGAPQPRRRLRRT